MVEETINMDEIAQLLCKWGYAAYVEQTGGGCATIYASRQWVIRIVNDNGRQREVQYPFTDEQDRYEMAAGPGWFEPHWLAPRAKALGTPLDFYVGRDDDGETDAQSCAGMNERAIADLIATKLKEL